MAIIKSAKRTGAYIHVRGLEDNSLRSDARQNYYIYVQMRNHQKLSMDLRADISSGNLWLNDSNLGVK